MTEIKIMPEEPTGEMIDASQCECGSGADHVDYVHSDYKAMRAARDKGEGRWMKRWLR